MNLELATLVFAGPKPKCVDAVFYHALHDVMIQASGLDFVLMDVVRAHRVRQNIVLNGDNGRTVGGIKPGEAWSGFESWYERLEPVIPVPIIGTAPPGTHTREEVVGFLQKAQELGLHSVFVLTTPAHMIRVMMTYVLEMLEAPEKERVRVYPLISQSVQWFEPINGSLAKPLENYRAYVEEESGRLDLYMQRRWISTFEELAAYLRWRDSVETLSL